MVELRSRGRLGGGDEIERERGRRGLARRRSVGLGLPSFVCLLSLCGGHASKMDEKGGNLVRVWEVRLVELVLFLVGRTLTVGFRSRA